MTETKISWLPWSKKAFQKSLCTSSLSAYSFGEVVFSKRKTMTASSVAIMNSGRIMNDGNSGMTV